MGTLRPPLPVKLFVGMIAVDVPMLDLCSKQLVERFGPVDLKSAVLPWDHTDYYGREMGEGLRRVFLFFRQLIDPGELVQIKRSASLLEQEHARPGTDGSHRRINLDPGYITEAKVVLATTKDFPHRVYIGQGVYAESTLHFSKQARSFQAVEHTDPDFRSKTATELFNTARELLRQELARREAG